MRDKRRNGSVPSRWRLRVPSLTGSSCRLRLQRRPRRECSLFGGQPEVVAETILVRRQLSVSRDIFFIRIGRFDTHASQALSLPALLTQIDSGVIAFDISIQEIGLSEDVTLFTVSDLGKMLAVNGDGVDHCWGRHSFVIKGSLSRQYIFRSVPH